MATDYYFWGISKSGFSKREGKDGLLMHDPIPAVFSLFFLPLSFSPFFLRLVTYHSLVVGCFSPLSIFPFESPSP